MQIDTYQGEWYVSTPNHYTYDWIAAYFWSLWFLVSPITVFFNDYGLASFQEVLFTTVYTVFFLCGLPYWTFKVYAISLMRWEVLNVKYHRSEMTAWFYDWDWEDWTYRL